tara:strand:- start:5460 stop:5729 length:270 start_codon:yes stop_codon:yes gene_type:complete
MTKKDNSILQDPDKVQYGGEHYKQMTISPWDVIDSFPLEQKVGAYRANAIKYILRMGAKDDQILEVKKAIHYLRKLKKVLEENVKHPND